MRTIKIDSLRLLSHNVNDKEVKIICPMSIAHPEGPGACDVDCAWYNEKKVTDSGGMGSFCGDKFIGNLKTN